MISQITWSNFLRHEFIKWPGVFHCTSKINIDIEIKSDAGCNYSIFNCMIWWHENCWFYCDCIFVKKASSVLLLAFLLKYQTFQIFLVYQIFYTYFFILHTLKSINSHSIYFKSLKLLISKIYIYLGFWFMSITVSIVDETIFAQKIVLTRHCYHLFCNCMGIASNAWIIRCKMHKGNDLSSI